MQMNQLIVIAFTHHVIGLDEIGKFHLGKDAVSPRMRRLREELKLEEVMYLSTCNRVELVLVTRDEADSGFISRLLQAFHPEWKADYLTHLVEKCRHWKGVNAVHHLMEVATSLDSMVIGEREIITQMKEAYHFARAHGLSGDLIRIVMRQVIETAKKVYTETAIAAKPVSVVALAFRHLQQKQLDKQARILMVGAGITMTNMGRFLQQNGFQNFTVFNRTLEKGRRLTDLLGGEAYSLEQVDQFKGGFDVLISCTGSVDPVITLAVYTALSNGEQALKTVIDLAVPADVDPQVKALFDIDYIGVQQLKATADRHLNERKKELVKVHHLLYEAVEEFKEIFEMRRMELKIRSIPEKVKAIKSKAMNEVFSKDLQKLDEKSKEVVEKIIDYMEKKYISVPMLMAKEMVARQAPRHED